MLSRPQVGAVTGVLQLRQVRIARVKYAPAHPGTACLLACALRSLSRSLEEDHPNAVGSEMCYLLGKQLITRISEAGKQPSRPKFGIRCQEVTVGDYY